MTAETNTTDHKRLIGWVGAFIGTFDRCNDIAQEDRGNFNIFDALGITEREQCHSNIIAEILNPDGQHGLSTAGLRHFIDMLIKLLKGTAGEASTIKHAGVLQDWQCEGTSVEREHAGRRGTVDILLTDGSNKHAIVIENKIGSKEEEKQLKRYRDNHPQALLVFLTLDGKESDTANDENDYLRLSYRKEGVGGWIQKCEQVARYPAVRESLIQYRKTIQSLTGERIDVMEERSNIMKEELCKIITADKESLRAAFEIQGLSICEMLWEKNVIPTLKEHAKERGLPYDEIYGSWGKKGYGFSFYRTEGKACRIWFVFDGAQMCDLCYGFYYDTTVPKEVKDACEKMIKDSQNQSNSESAWKREKHWLLWRYMEEEFRHWNSGNTDRWVEFHNPKESKTLKRVKKALGELLDIAEKHDIPL